MDLSQMFSDSSPLLLPIILWIIAPFVLMGIIIPVAKAVARYFKNRNR